MRWRKETASEWKARIWKWHPWFAWHPVRIGGDMVWLETIERYGKVFFWPYHYPLVVWGYRYPSRRKP